MKPIVSSTLVLFLALCSLDAQSPKKGQKEQPQQPVTSDTPITVEVNRVNLLFTVTDKKVDYIAPSFGAGLNVKLGPTLMLNVQETFLYSSADNRDGVVAANNDMYLLHMVGLTFNFGKKRDEEGI